MIYGPPGVDRILTLHILSTSGHTNVCIYIYIYMLTIIQHSNIVLLHTAAVYARCMTVMYVYFIYIPTMSAPPVMLVGLDSPQ